MIDNKYFSYIFIVRSGREEKTLKDILDFLFTFDMKVTYEKTHYPSIIFIKTTLPVNDIKKYLKDYPIRHIINVRYVLVDKKINNIKIDQILDTLSKIEPNPYLFEVRFHGIDKRDRGKIREILSKKCKGSIRKKYILDLFKDRLLISIKIFSQYKKY